MPTAASTIACAYTTGSSQPSSGKYAMLAPRSAAGSMSGSSSANRRAVISSAA
jgi:hypothetical protein